MCLIGLQWRSPHYRLRLAANRDEFHDRPTAAADWWPPEASGEVAIFGGRDLQAGGGWLACTPEGRFAAVTNVRGSPPTGQQYSRGSLVSTFLGGRRSPEDFLAALAAEAAHYAGFNLLVSDGHRCCYASNTPTWHWRHLSPGVHVVSNADLDTPWPKTERLRAALEADGDDAALFRALADEQAADDHALPDTGVGREMERFLSPPFIRGRHYGTRASTIVSWTGDGPIAFEERRFAADGVPTGRTHTLVRRSNDGDTS
ncbi:NRDE family protein [Algiphilus sp.]|uniref:NRDE family protein n=1 Tax=Algiphilus sp. TaxID=1872431 RepID=UPI001CA765CA|nr:NRDE family protein [Algiphilus acroporae]MCI5061729.1 NRDE family protein [Algiphilus sp.]MCR9091164.1 NRDE family protein [Pseudomonadota bacterium]